MLDIDADDLTLFIEIDDHAVLNFARIDARARVQAPVAVTKVSGTHSCKHLHVLIL